MNDGQYYSGDEENTFHDATDADHDFEEGGEEDEFDEEGYWKDAARAEWAIRHLYPEGDESREILLEILTNGGVPEWTLEISNEFLEYQDEVVEAEQALLELFGENLVGEEPDEFKEDKERLEYRILELQSQMEEIKPQLREALEELIVRDEEDDESAQHKHSVGFVADGSSDQLAISVDADAEMTDGESKQNDAQSDAGRGDG